MRCCKRPDAAASRRAKAKATKKAMVHVKAGTLPKPKKHHAKKETPKKQAPCKACGPQKPPPTIPIGQLPPIPKPKPKPPVNWLNR